MKKNWMKHKVKFLAAGLVILMSAAFMAGSIWSGTMADKAIVEAAENEVKEGTGEEEYQYIPTNEDSLYAERVNNFHVGEKIGKQVCEKFGLDYDTVKVSELTRDMLNYEEALTCIRDIGDCPLYKEYAEVVKEGKEERDGWSLELYIDEVYAFSGGRDVIQTYCLENNIDPDKSVVSDLTTDDLIAIGELAYETSDHPKD